MSQPAHKIRISNLSVTIWRNTSDKGVWYSANPSRSYKKPDNWLSQPASKQALERPIRWPATESRLSSSRAVISDRQ